MQAVDNTEAIQWFRTDILNSIARHGMRGVCADCCKPTPVREGDRLTAYKCK
jgi:hypothetical protein